MSDHTEKTAPVQEQLPTSVAVKIHSVHHRSVDLIAKFLGERIAYILILATNLVAGHGHEGRS